MVISLLWLCVLLFLPILWFSDIFTTQQMVTAEALALLSLIVLTITPSLTVEIILKWCASLFFIVASAFLLFFINAHYLTSASIVSTSSDKLMNNETLLAVLSTLAIFASVLVYVFKEIVKRDLEKDYTGVINTLSEKTGNDDHNERIAAKLETRITASSTLTKLYMIGLRLRDKAQTATDPKEAQFLLEVAEVYSAGRYLKGATDVDISAIELSKEMRGDNRHKDVLLKVKNNRAYNLCLKHDKNRPCDNFPHDKLSDDYEQDMLIARQIKTELERVIQGEAGGNHYYDINDNHKRSFFNTCKDIERVFRL